LSKGGNPAKRGTPPLAKGGGEGFKEGISNSQVGTKSDLFIRPMIQLKSEDLMPIKEKALSTMIPKEGEFRCMVCAGTGCVSCNSFKVREQLEAALKDRGLTEKVKVVITGCNGFCAEGPLW